ncbi:MAG: M23 family metallopeptidase [Clostridia bacterium]|nr:M23 family metallopeptidase [Clostridia bacterium]
MAIDPVTAKIITQQLTKIALDEEKRTKFILAISIVIVFFLLIIFVPLYLIMNPIETIKLLLSDEDIGIVESLKKDNPNIPQKGELVFKGKFPLPIQGTITSDYGYRINPITGKEEKHTGIDISGKHRDNIISVEDGIVTFAGLQKGYGNCIEIKHELESEIFYSFYAHMSRIDVIVGQELEQGDIIGQEGGDPSTDPYPGYSTGHHLHFEIRLKNGYGNDIDPIKYIF